MGRGGRDAEEEEKEEEEEGGEEKGWERGGTKLARYPTPIGAFTCMWTVEDEMVNGEFSAVERPRKMHFIEKVF